MATRWCLVLQHFEVEGRGAGIDVLRPVLCKSVGANGGCSHQKKSNVFHRFYGFRVNMFIRVCAFWGISTAKLQLISQNSNFR